MGDVANGVRWEDRLLRFAVVLFVVGVSFHVARPWFG